MKDSDRPQTLKKGMYVRVPLDLDRQDLEYRDYYIGRLESFQELANTITITLINQTASGEWLPAERVLPRTLARRCRVLPATQFIHTDSKKTGVILSACTDLWEDGQYMDYHVELEGRVERLTENKLYVCSHRGNPNPFEQLLRYEFHHPSFKFPRDRLVESYTELQTATFGMEDLVGSRIMLLAHQAETVARVLSDSECRYILADEVGLGKTIEASVILKGLRRRHGNIRTLVVTPSSLTAQWYFELDQKFWLRFATSRHLRQFIDKASVPGLIVSTEELETRGDLLLTILTLQWDLLIIDEAHHLRTKPALFEHLCGLSEETERVLVLSATPIQRRTEEFLFLLRLMDPVRYEPLSPEQFRDIMGAQYDLLKLVAGIVPDLKPEYFDPDDFKYGMNAIVDLLDRDPLLDALVAKVEAGSDRPDKGLQLAKDTIAYISENYRVERRVIRNRRINLQIDLPEREVNVSFAYSPGDSERACLDELYSYLDHVIAESKQQQGTLEYARTLLNAAFSSPHALLAMLEYRRDALKTPAGTSPDAQWEQLVAPGNPRQEDERIRQLIKSLSQISNEERDLEDLIWYTESWKEETNRVLESLPYRSRIEAQPHRLVQVLRVVRECLASNRETKIVVFSTWYRTLLLLKGHLRKHWGSQAIAEFHVQVEEKKLQEEVDRFQRDAECRVLLCDELGGEGRNFQMAGAIVHVDLPWTPARLEQRIGRVDRLGREGAVLSTIPYAKQQLEADLYRIWQNAFQLFTRSLSGMEIALEEIQEELLVALKGNTRNGLVNILDEMVERASMLRDQVEEERYYEEEAINTRRRREFSELSDKYRDGGMIRGPVLRWAEQAGLRPQYNYRTDTVQYSPRQFSLNAMQNAKFVSVPNMETALARSRNANMLRITGTFNRSLALVREDLVFFAPGSDPWTDAIINNAIEADRGRSCAIRRKSSNLNEPWRGLELFYRLTVDPRPLFELGHDPVHLLRAQGYLYVPVYRLLVSDSGEILPPSSILYKIVEQPLSFRSDTHLGRRSDQDPQLQIFKTEYPPDVWESMLRELLKIAREAIAEDFSFTEELALEAQEDFAHISGGLRAAHLWLARHNVLDRAISRRNLTSVEELERISSALTAGISNPRWHLESASFWILEPED
jgi:ATP-dependent helicase HepA